MEYNNNGESPLDNNESGSKKFFKEQFLTVTPLSKYLALFLFIMLPIAGFYFGVLYKTEITYTELNHGQITHDLSKGAGIQITEGTTPTEDKIAPNVGVSGSELLTPDKVIQKILNKYDSFLTDPKPADFYWPEGSKDTNNVLKISGIEVHVEESLVTPTEGGVDMAFVLDEFVTSILTENGFSGKTFFLDKNGTIEDKSIIGFESSEMGLVCARIIYDASKPQMGYQVACGFKQQ